MFFNKFLLRFEISTRRSPYVFRAYLKSSESFPRLPQLLKTLSKVFLTSFTSLFYYLFKQVVMRTTSTFLSNISIRRSSSQVTFYSIFFFKYSIVRQGLELLTNSYSSIAFLSLFASFIRFYIFYPVARSLSSIVRSSIRSGYLTIINLQSDINEYIFSKIYHVMESLKLDNMIIRSIMDIFFDNLLVKTSSSLITIRLYLFKSSSRGFTPINFSYI